jgi:hypothetical protein
VTTPDDPSGNTPRSDRLSQRLLAAGGLLLLAALVLRAISGVTNGYTFLFLSIGASVLSATCLVTAYLRARRASRR